MPDNGYGSAGQSANGSSVPIPLTFAQQRLWFVYSWDPTASKYHYPVNVRIRGILDADALSTAISEIVEQHWILRSGIEEVNGRACQVVNPNEFFLGCENLEDETDAARDLLVRKRVHFESVRPFDLAKSPFRGCLLKLASDEFILLLTFHHIAFDGWSLGVFASDLEYRYAMKTGKEPLEYPTSPTMQYGDFAVWQQGEFRDSAFDEAVAYWQSRLISLPPTLNIPTERDRPEALSGETGRVWMNIDEELSAQVKALARSCKATPFMFFMAAFQSLLAIYSGQNDFLIGSASSGRSVPETFEIIGLFVNQIVFRSSCEDDLRFTDLIAKVRQRALEAYKYDSLPFEKVVEIIQ